jgi:hypothetical protein
MNLKDGESPEDLKAENCMNSSLDAERAPHNLLIQNTVSWDCFYGRAWTTLTQLSLRRWLLRSFSHLQAILMIRAIDSPSATQSNKQNIIYG